MLPLKMGLCKDNIFILLYYYLTSFQFVPYFHQTRDAGGSMGSALAHITESKKRVNIQSGQKSTIVQSSQVSYIHNIYPVNIYK